MATYKWAGPHEWLNEKVQKLANEDGDTIARHEAVTELVSIIDALAHHLDADSIQDLFQEEMDADGYFKDKGEHHD